MNGCFNQVTLQAWLDGELSPEAAADVRLHLTSCAVCTAHVRDAQQTLLLVGSAWDAELPATAPARLRARVEEGLARPARDDRRWWHAAFASWQVGAAAAVIAIMVTTGVIIRSNRSAPLPARQETARLSGPRSPGQPNLGFPKSAAPAPPSSAMAIPSERNTSRPTLSSGRRIPTRRATWLEVETNKHLEQAQVLLRSIRNTEDASLDLAYERELSRELLSRNRLLRRSAEQKDGRRAEELLSHIEPILIDIANLPDMPAAGNMRSIQELIRDQQIIAELQLYTRRTLF